MSIFAAFIAQLGTKIIVLCTISVWAPTLLGFLIGFYQIFQVVFIDESGISVMFFKKEVRKFEWNSIVLIKEASVLRNPAYSVIKNDGTEIHLDKRKKIKKAIEYYYKKPILYSQ
jgi:hypothetical protein